MSAPASSDNPASLSDGISADDRLRTQYGPDYPLGPFTSGSHFNPGGSIVVSHAGAAGLTDGDIRFRLTHNDLQNQAIVKPCADGKSGAFVSRQGGLTGRYVVTPHGELRAQFASTDGGLRGETSTWVDGAARGYRVELCQPDGSITAEGTHQRVEHWISPPFGLSSRDPRYHATMYGSLDIVERQ